MGTVSPNGVGPRDALMPQIPEIRSPRTVANRAVRRALRAAGGRV